PAHERAGQPARNCADEKRPQQAHQTAGHLQADNDDNDRDDQPYHQRHRFLLSWLQLYRMRSGAALRRVKHGMSEEAPACGEGLRPRPGILSGWSPAAMLAGSAPAAQQPVFRGTSDAVHVFVTVTDRDGRLVTTLSKDAFDVRDDGKTQPITLFDNTPQPIRLIVLLDVSGSMEGNLPLLRAASEQLFARLRPDDLARVGSFGREITIAPAFAQDAETLRRELPDSVSPDAPTPLWRAVNQAMDAFGGEASEARRVILVLSDGKDSGPISFRERYVSQGEVIDRARRDDVMVYGIGMRSRGSRPIQP